jgi:CRISPR-associated protein Cas1
MEAVYVLTPGSFLRKDGATLKVVKDGQTIETIAAEGLKRLMLVGYVSLTGGVLDFLIRRRIETVFVTPTGRFRARLGLDEHRHVERRRAQYLKLSDPAFAARTASLLVHGKIRNLLSLLTQRARQYNDEHIAANAARMLALGREAAAGGSLERLRGLEGAGTQAYFNAFGRMVRNDAFSFNGRNRRPPRDPVNALLSFVYTLLTNEVLSAIKAVGLDPYLGALHEVAYGRPSLACDLVEEYRAHLGDRLVLGLINRRMIGPEDFVYRPPPPDTFVDEADLRANRPVEMKPAVARTFIAAYEEMMNRRITDPIQGRKVTYRGLMLNQVGRFAAYLEDPEKVYAPFAWEG